MSSSIGIFDSGYGGLTILKAIEKELPEYNYVYLGDNARAPYGTRSFDVIYQYTLEAVKFLISQNCQLIILACNTASARALRTIQQSYLPIYAPHCRVLGVLRPCTEIAGNLTATGHLGLLATAGTVSSNSYGIETANFFPKLHLHQQSCPMLVPLIENNEIESVGAEHFIKQYVDELLEMSPQIDAVLLACTHYPILLPKLRKIIPETIKIIDQGPIVSKALKVYINRHQWLKNKLSTEMKRTFFSTENSDKFSKAASALLKREVNTNKITLGSI